MSGIDLKFSSALGGFRLEAAFRIPGRGVTALFGPSGSGKTTVLRCMAGLERRARGHMRVNGETWQDDGAGVFLPTHRRPLGYVFQEASLFPHLSVRRNLDYGRRRIGAGERRVGFDDAVGLVGIGHLLDRKPARLSGGERQRVAIARALLTGPRLLLMDEPLSALDEQSKAEILPYLEQLHRELSIPVVYVSHSLREVARLADYMVSMGGGTVQAAGPLHEVLTRLDVAAAQGEEAGAVVETVVAGHEEDYQLTVLESPCGRLWVRRMAAAPGTPVRVRLPARDISLSLHDDAESSILNVWRTEVGAIEPLDNHQVLVRLHCPQAPGGHELIARVTRKSCDHLDLAPGRSVYARIKSVGLME